ncbi:ATP-binding cassette domain-containing protein, partial [Bittarella massiliensis (ex Durand et al. 2017)]|nr:ATP-binding cassette domain-containing protein [Bittarella massiliensis (ex Durand et al. 2017)]
MRGLSLTVRRGDWYCLLGGNGAGKSTALKLIAGLLKPNRGRVKVADGLALGVLPQNPQALFTELSAEEELFDALADLPGTDRARREGVEEMLALLELTDRRAAHPYDLSGGGTAAAGPGQDPPA